MTLNELNLIYFDARKKLQDELSARHEDDISTEPHLAGIRAVVEALRDEMTLGWEDDRPWGDVADVKKFLNKILASDGEEKAAGGSARKDETYAGAGALKVPVTASAPAAAPVCVWTRIDEDVLESGCDPDGWTYNPEIKRDTCPQCGKPISFKSEAAR